MSLPPPGLAPHRGAPGVGRALTPPYPTRRAVVCGGLTETVLRSAGVQGLSRSETSQGSEARLLEDGDAGQVGGARGRERSAGALLWRPALRSPLTPPRQPPEEDGASRSERSDSVAASPEAARHVPSGMHSKWKHFDRLCVRAPAARPPTRGDLSPLRRFMQPTFGGHYHPRPPLPNEVVHRESLVSDREETLHELARREADDEHHSGRELEQRQSYHPPLSSAAATAFGGGD